MKAIHVMPALLLQKPSKTSKSKDHVYALERRLEIWHKGNLRSLLNEAETIQSRLPEPTKKSDIATISKRFRNLMEKGNVNGAIKILTNNMSGGIVPLTDETLNILQEKHPVGEPLNVDIAIQGPIKPVHPILFEVIDEDLVLKAARHTEGGSGPSGLDADGWRKPLVSKVYGDAGNDLRKALAKVIRAMCTEEVEDSSLTSFLACRLVPLSKKPTGVRPIGVGEVMRRLIGKVIGWVLKPDIHEVAGPLQTAMGLQGGAEPPYTQ